MLSDHMVDSGKRVVYMMITKDKFELPLAIADSAEELAKMVGVLPSGVYSGARNVQKGKRKSKYIRVLIDKGEGE